MYVNAVRAMYEGYATEPGTKRWDDYLALMRQLRGKYPDDINASLFYGLGLTWTAGPGEMGLEQRRQALAIFLPIFQKYPNNPGAASARVASAWVKAGRDGMGDEFHALNNIEYAALQLGEDQKAKAIMAEITALTQNQKRADLWLSVDARIYYDLETHNWLDATQIEPPPASAFEENFDAYWIESIGAARSGDAKRARAALDKYRNSETAWNKSHGWGDILGVGLAEAEAWTLFSESKQQEAVTRLRSIAGFERDHPMYYADILPRPTEEMLGDMLLRMNRPADALLAYQASLKLAPNRLDSLVGASKAAKLAGQTSASTRYASEIKNEGGQLATRP
jgi:tetratricopeptide (TPR) repeat protein